MGTKSDYFWNTEFIELVNQKICPYCEAPLTVKGKLKTCKCSFYLLGSPEILAYEKIPSITDKQHNYHFKDDDKISFFCDECGNTDLIKDPSRGELICKCGLVVQGPPAYSSYRKISYDSFNLK